MIYFVALLVPTVVAFFIMIFNHEKITLKEFFVQLGVQALLVSGVVYLTMSSTYSDVEIWNGEVTNKRYYSERKTSTYSCNCRPKRGCSICTRSWTEYNWVIDTNLRETICLRCGSLLPIAPALYSTIQVGDPVASPHSYDNPIKAAPQTLFRNSGNKNVNWQIPQYPSQIYDAIKLNRIVTVNGVPTPPKEMQDKLSVLNMKLGPKKQANLILVVVKDYPSSYFYMLREKWLGGKKNDIISVIGVDQNSNINWVEIMAWSKDHMIEVTLRDDIKSVGTLDYDKIFEKIEQHTVTDYVRQPMAEFEYLFAQVTPTTGQWVFFLLCSIVISIGLSVAMFKHDLFGDEVSNRFRRRF